MPMMAKIKEQIPECLQNLVIEFLSEETVNLKDVFVQLACDKNDEYNQCIGGQTTGHMYNLSDAAKYANFAARIFDQLIEPDADGTSMLLHAQFGHFLTNKDQFPDEHATLLYENLNAMVKHFAPTVVQAMVAMSAEDEKQEQKIIAHICKCWFSPDCKSCQFRAPCDALESDDNTIATITLRKMQELGLLAQLEANGRNMSKILAPNNSFGAVFAWLNKPGAPDRDARREM